MGRGRGDLVTPPKSGEGIQPCRGSHGVGGGEVNDNTVVMAASGTSLVASEMSSSIGGVVVQGTVQRREQLSSKAFCNGGFRETAKITGLLPHGGGAGARSEAHSGSARS